MSDLIGLIASGYDSDKDRVSWAQVEEFLEEFHGDEAYFYLKAP